MKSMRILALAALILVLTATLSDASWLFYHKPAFKGMVVDAETKQPIEGVVVVVVYRKWQWWFLEATERIVNIRETLTDKQGVFRFPPYTTLIDPVSISRFVDFIIFKPGYGYFEPHGMDGDDQEVFFSQDFGKMRDIKLLVGTESHWFRVPFGIVELPKLKTREERIKFSISPEGEPSDWKKQKLLIKAIREEHQYLYGKYPSALYNWEDFK